MSAIAGSAIGWPLSARAQAKKVPVVGVLWPNPPSQFEPIRQGLKDLGYVEDKNIRFEFRWAAGALDKLPEMALDLVRIPVDLIVSQGLARAGMVSKKCKRGCFCPGKSKMSGISACLTRAGRFDGDQALGIRVATRVTR